jgi:hypothetical protein
MAVYDIIENKLYRDRNLNVENYFKTYWKISRAQGWFCIRCFSHNYTHEHTYMNGFDCTAYRLYNCAVILKEMEGFAILPLRERYCRILKKLCKTPEERRELW